MSGSWFEKDIPVYENDLQRELLAVRSRGDAGLKKFAVRFGVSYRWAQKVLRQNKLTGQAERVRHRPGLRSRMNDEIAAYMKSVKKLGGRQIENVKIRGLVQSIPRCTLLNHC